MIDIDSLVKTAPEIQKIVAKNFKLRRKEHKITQITLAQKAGVSLPSLKRFEQTGEISFKNLLKISQTLGYEKEFLSLFSKPYYTNIEDMLRDS